MRLQQIQTKHTFFHKFLMGILQLFTRLPVPDALKVLLYRKEFFGKPFAGLTHKVMRGDSHWSIGERELFAAFVSQLSKCEVGTKIHAAATSLALGENLTTAVLEDWRTAPVAPPLRAALGFLEKFTLTPEQMTNTDIRELRQIGLSDQAIREVIAVGTIFNVMDRIAMALDFAVPGEEELRKRAKLLLQGGYKI